MPSLPDAPFLHPQADSQRNESKEEDPYYAHALSKQQHPYAEYSPLSRSAQYERHPDQDPLQ